MNGVHMSARTLFCAVLLFAGFIVPLSAQEKVVRVAAGEWPPFISESLEGKGFVAKIVDEAFSKSGYRVEWGFFPWKRSYDLAAAGDWDATVPWMPSDERAQAFLISDALFISTESLVFTKGHLLQWKDLSDLKNVKIAAALGYFYGDAFASAEETGLIKVERSDDETNLRKLISGRVEAVAINPVVGWDLLRTLAGPKSHELYAFSTQTLRSAGSSLFVSKHSAHRDEIFAAFQRALAEMAKNGSLKAYYDEMLKQ